MIYYVFLYTNVSALKTVIIKKIYFSFLDGLPKVNWPTLVPKRKLVHFICMWPTALVISWDLYLIPSTKKHLRQCMSSFWSESAIYFDFKKPCPYLTNEISFVYALVTCCIFSWLTLIFILSTFWCTKYSLIFHSCFNIEVSIAMVSIVFSN